MERTLSKNLLILTASVGLVVGLIIRPLLTLPAAHSQEPAHMQAPTPEIGVGPGRYQLVMGSDREMLFLDTRTGRIWMWVPETTSSGSVPTMAWKEMATPVTQPK